ERTELEHVEPPAAIGEDRAGVRPGDQRARPAVRPNAENRDLEADLAPQERGCIEVRALHFPEDVLDPPPGSQVGGYPLEEALAPYDRSPRDVEHGLARGQRELALLPDAERPRVPREVRGEPFSCRTELASSQF